MENVGCLGMAEQWPPSCSKGAVDAGSSAEFGTAAANGTLEDVFIGKLMKIGLFLAIKLGKLDGKGSKALLELGYCPANKSF